MVRGLDYYTRTTFEMVATDKTGAQNAVAAGGRYDGLVEELGGPPTPGIGFGMGIERVILSLKQQGVVPPPLPALPVLARYLEIARVLLRTMPEQDHCVGETRQFDRLDRSAFEAAPDEEARAGKTQTHRDRLRYRRRASQRVRLATTNRTSARSWK